MTNTVILVTFVADILTGFLSRVGRERYVIKGDGNCLFRALAHVLTGDQENHGHIRLLVQRFENLNQDLFEKLLTEVNKPTIKEHMLHVGIPHTWGTHIEVFAISTYLQIPVFSCTVDHNKNPSNSIKWEAFKPLLPVSELHYPVPIADTCSLQLLTHIELLYFTDLHYDCILSSLTEKPCTSQPQLSSTVCTIEL